MVGGPVPAPTTMDDDGALQARSAVAFGHLAGIFSGSQAGSPVCGEEGPDTATKTTSAGSQCGAANNEVAAEAMDQADPLLLVKEWSSEILKYRNKEYLWNKEYDPLQLLYRTMLVAFDLGIAIGPHTAPFFDAKWQPKGQPKFLSLNDLDALTAEITKDLQIAGVAGAVSNPRLSSSSPCVLRTPNKEWFNFDTPNITMELNPMHPIILSLARKANDAKAK